MYVFVLSISFLEQEIQINIHERNRDGKRCGSDDGSGREHLSSNVTEGYLGAGKKSSFVVSMIFWAALCGVAASLL